MTEFIGLLHSPMTQEEWDIIQDVELEHTKSITYHTPKGKQVRFINEDVLDKISAEILALSAEPFHEFDYGYNLGLIGAARIIDKYKESEGKNDSYKIS